MKQEVQVNFEDFYYSKLCNLWKISYSKKEIDSHYYSDFYINSKNYISQFCQIFVSQDLYLLVVKKVHDQTVFGYLGYQKIISFLTHNYYLLKIKDEMHCFI